MQPTAGIKFKQESHITQLMLHIKIKSPTDCFTRDRDHQGCRIQIKSIVWVSLTSSRCFTQIYSNNRLSTFLNQLNSNFSHRKPWSIHTDPGFTVHCMGPLVLWNFYYTFLQNVFKAQKKEKGLPPKFAVFSAKCEWRPKNRFLIQALGLHKSAWPIALR